jgi:N-acetylneuraminic acid mutarotase
MLVARSDPMATLMADGRVLVVGGDVAGNSTTASAEIYDPAANTWTATASMAEPRTRASITLLPNGKVLVAGGYSTAGSMQFKQTVEMYDPASGTWSPVGTMLVARAQHAAQLLPDGSAVLLIGGVNGLGHVGSAELFLVASGVAQSVAGSIPGGNIYDAVSLADGSILAVTDTGTTAVRFHPATSSWTTSTLASGTRRLLATLTLLADGRVLFAGGFNLATAEIYNPDIDTWTNAAPLSTARNRASASLLADGSVLVVGGASGSGEIATAERFAP